MIAAHGATRANLETAPSPVSSEDGNAVPESPSCKRPRLMQDELMPDAEPPCAASRGHAANKLAVRADTTSRRSVAAGLLRNLHQLQRGKEQMTASSYHVVFLADKSGSMTFRGQRPSERFCTLGYPNPLGCALEACDRFVRMRHAAGASDKVSLIMFDNGVEPAIHGADLHPELIINLLQRVHWNYGGTAFHGAFEKASSFARRESMPVLLMFLTDGCDGGCQARLGLAIRELSQNVNVSMKAIGFGSECNAAHLQELAGRFGERGEYLAAIDGVQLVESFEAAAAELSHTGGR